VRISPSIDYQMNKRINLRLFVNYQHNLPKTSAAFETTNIEGGLTVRFTLN
jgi:cell surface protein SprA